MTDSIFENINEEGPTVYYEKAIACFKRNCFFPGQVLSFSAEMHRKAGQFDLALQ